MALIHVHQQTHNLKVKILLETSTGQGSEIGYKLEDLSFIYRKLSKHKNINVRNRFGICLDTCHIFVAGYNIKNKNTRKIYFDKFNELIGFKHIKLIHLNDSKNNIGSKIDRHENIGNGYIGKIPLLTICQIFKNLHIPIILETPYRNIINDLKLLNTNLL